MTETKKEKDDRHLKIILVQLGEDYHINALDHDPENFRGCTHPFCVSMRATIKTLRVNKSNITKP